MRGVRRASAAQIPIHPRLRLQRWIESHQLAQQLALAPI